MKCREIEYSELRFFSPPPHLWLASYALMSGVMQIFILFLLSTPLVLFCFFICLYLLYHSSFYGHNQDIKILRLFIKLCVCVSNLRMNMGILLFLFVLYEDILYIHSILEYIYFPSAVLQSIGRWSEFYLLSNCARSAWKSVAPTRFEPFSANFDPIAKKYILKHDFVIHGIGAIPYEISNTNRLK